MSGSDMGEGMCAEAPPRSQPREAVDRGDRPSPSCALVSCLLQPGVFNGRGWMGHLTAFLCKCNGDEEDGEEEEGEEGEKRGEGRLRAIALSLPVSLFPLARALQRKAHTRACCCYSIVRFYFDEMSSASAAVGYERMKG